MSTTAGVFSETVLKNIMIRADEIMLDNGINMQYKPFGDVLKTQLDKQTVRITPLEETAKDREVEIEWINACGITATAGSDCTFSGGELSTNIKTYALAQTRVAEFTVKESTFLTNDFNFEDAMAKGMLAADKVLYEYIAQAAVTAYNDFSGINQFTGGKGTVATTTTSIPAAYWTAELMSYFVRVIQLNKFTAPYIQDGNNLSEQMMQAEWRRGVTTKNDAAIMFGAVPYFMDMYNIDAVNNSNKYTYLINQNAVVFAHKVYFPSIPSEVGEYVRFSKPCTFDPRIKFDVIIKKTCGTNELLDYAVKVKTKFDFFNNPAGCNEDVTGVIRFACS